MLDLLFMIFFYDPPQGFFLLTSSNNFNPLKHVVKIEISCNLGNKFKKKSEKQVNKKKTNLNPGSNWVSFTIQPPFKKIGIPIKSPTKKLKHKWIRLKICETPKIQHKVPVFQ